MEWNEFKKRMLTEEQAKKLEQYRRLNPFARKGQIVFTGSSLMDFFPVNELLQSLEIDACVYNRGISGYVSEQMLENMDTLILDLAPTKLFINIGTNDLGRGIVDGLWANYETILRRVQEKLPGCKIYVMAYYPCNNRDDFGLSEADYAARFKTRTPESLREANRELARMAARLGCRFIDVNEGLYDAEGLLRREICMDGVHLYADGYVPVLRNLRPYLEE